MYKKKLIETYTCIFNLVHKTGFWKKTIFVRDAQKIGKPNNVKVFGSKESKDPVQDTQNRSWSPISQRGDPKV
jgi:hypothetical protein